MAELGPIDPAPLPDLPDPAIGAADQAVMDEVTRTDTDLRWLGTAAAVLEQLRLTDGDSCPRAIPDAVSDARESAWAAVLARVERIARADSAR